jgi:hypothetical protein
MVLSGRVGLAHGHVAALLKSWAILPTGWLPLYTASDGRAGRPRISSVVSRIRVRLSKN